MTTADRWVLASGNSGKVREIHTMLPGSGIEIVAQSEFAIESVEETGSTFVENALLKARHATLHTGLPAIADDSGLAVDALSGAPGIHSARYAGSPANDLANVGKLLDALANTPDIARGARFHCVIVAMLNPEDPAHVVSHGTWNGSITRSPMGEGGFGYDPVFFDANLNATAAQLQTDLKNRVSHRGQALIKLADALNKRVKRS